MTIKLDGNIIGLDVGSKRIGVARVNTFVKLPEPLQHIDVDSQDAFEAILSIISEHEASAIVCGLPRGLDGQETSQTTISREFALKLKEYTEIPIYMIDEAGTSKEADERLTRNSSISRDSMAACIILEDFIVQDNQEALQV
jgi:putative Holliday junction resolvase